MKTEKAVNSPVQTPKKTKASPGQTASNKSRTDKKNNSPKNVAKMKIIPLGGLEEIGKNFTLVECEDDIIIIDCGIKFPDIDMFGIDYVIPDLSYLEDKGHKIRGLFITHGHEDHIGGIPYFLKKFPNVPIYGTKLTIGLITNKLVEHRIDKKTTMHTVSFGQIANVRGFSVEFIPTNHSIADSAMFYIKNKAGSLFFTGDFKIDLTPVDGQIIDLARIGQIGLEGVDLLVSDSTNATRKGYTQSEKTVGESFDVLFTNVKKRIVVATFATSIHRIQQVFDAAKQHRRKVVISGRSMVNVVGVARELKYLKFKDNILLDIKDLPKTHPEQVVLLTTGTQGEPMSALSRMAYGEHRQLSITEKDLVIISASPIPGNEKSVANIISELMKLGADVVYQGAGQVHVSGHGCQEEMKLIHALVKPKYFMPCHGEYHMLRTHAQLAESMGMSKNNIFLMQNGDVLQLDTESAKISGSVPSGIVFIDGTGIGDVGTIVLKDRKRLSQDGLLIIVATLDDHGLISGPDIVSRGFVYMRESEKLLSDAKNLCERVIKMNYFGYSDYSSIKNTIKFELERFLYDRTRRKPLVLPILMSAKSNLAKQIDRMRG